MITTKDSEQKRRSHKTTSYPDIVIDSKTPVPGNKLDFLSNKSNNKHFINFLATFLLKARIKVQHAGIEGDADVVIVKKVIELSHVMKTINWMASCKSGLTHILMILRKNRAAT